MSDRRIVERIVLPSMLQAILVSVRDGLGDDGAFLDVPMDMLKAALNEPLVDLPLERQGKVVRRSMRITLAAMRAIGAGDPPPSIAVQWRAVAALIVDMTHDDVIAVSDGSAFDRAFSEMLAMGFGVVSDADELHAERLAYILRIALAREGLFT